MQKIIQLTDIEKLTRDKKTLVVHDSAFEFLSIFSEFKRIKNAVFFSEFKSNPTYDDVLKGIKAFTLNSCENIISVGGGSAIDVAKCIRIWARSKTEPFESELEKNDITLIAVPTTAGTGSESTQFAVIYKNDVKYSIDNEILLPDYIVFEPSVLRTLPLYQKKCTLLDAFCQGIESIWAKRATKESRIYAAKAIRLILDNCKHYIFSENPNEETLKNIMTAANFSGKAINISRTTAAHAMSYKITSMFGIPHGLAAALCLAKVWEYTSSISLKTDTELSKSLRSEAFRVIADAFGTADISSAMNIYTEILKSFEFDPLPEITEKQLDFLVKSVNTERLSNNPVAFSGETIRKIYSEIFGGIV
jgi:alcohol dehydrogenase class IV